MDNMASTSSHPASGPLTLPDDLTRAIQQAGYYPALVADVVLAALGGDEVVSHLVHQETTFDHDVVRRHITVLALTTSRLVIAHADDHTDGGPGQEDVATATTESVPLSAVRGVMVTHVVARPQDYQPGSLGREITLTLGWGAVSRIDLMPASCADPDCDADHGYEGSVASDDISLRISADAEGEVALQQALDFAQALSTSIGP
ncbi:DUF5998 family protein [Pedococcus sp. KACC 23699]